MDEAPSSALLLSLVPLQETAWNVEELPEDIKALDGRRGPPPSKGQFTLLPKPSTQWSRSKVWDSHLNLLNCDAFLHVAPKCNSGLHFSDQSLLPLPECH